MDHSNLGLSETQILNIQQQCAHCKRLCWYHIASAYIPSYMQFCGTGINSPIVDGEPACQANCTAYTGIKYLFDISGMRDADWSYHKIQTAREDNFTWRTIMKICKDIVDFVAQGQNLLLYSNISGNGKTQAATFILKSYIQECVFSGKYNANLIRYVNIPQLVYRTELYDKLDRSDPKRIEFYDSLNGLARSNLVVWDDIGYDSNTRVESVIVRSIINSRINDSRSNIFISAGNLEELKEVSRRKDYERILDSSLALEFCGDCLRNHNKQDFCARQ